jgi:sarcosine oxidase gamma subunit
LLQQGSFVSLEVSGLAVGHAKRTLIAGVAAIIFHDCADVWLIGLERSRSCYFLEWIRACAAVRWPGQGAWQVTDVGVRNLSGSNV